MLWLLELAILGLILYLSWLLYDKIKSKVKEEIPEKIEIQLPPRYQLSGEPCIKEVLE